MDIENYEITPQGEIITFRRHSIQETGKENCCYALWQDKTTKHLVFGLLNSTHTHGIGLSINEHYKLILNHIERIIESEEVNVTYRYIPAPPELYGSGTMCEVIPTEVKATRTIPHDVISQLKKVISILNEYKEVI